MLPAVLPLVFEPNAGGYADEVAFLARGPNLLVLLERDGTVAYRSPAARGREEEFLRVRLSGAVLPRISAHDPEASNLRVYRHPAGGDAVETPRYTSVRFAGVYDGIDLTYRSSGGELEYEFRVDPGGCPSRVRLDFGKPMWRDNGGNLWVKTDRGLVRQRRPIAYQIIGGERAAVPVEFEISGSEVGFRTGDYNRRHPLMIDPVVTFSIQYGGSEWDSVHAVAMDAAGNVYLAGETASANLPGPAGVLSARANRDAFVTKLEGRSRIAYTTILGGGGNDAVRAITVAADGTVYIAGVTGGLGFPVTAGAHQPAFGGIEDAFVARLDPGGSLTYSTYLGASGADKANAIAVTAAGDVYVAGHTASPLFPTTSGAAQQSYRGGAFDGFLCKLRPGVSLTYSTLIGGGGTDIVNGIAVDGAGNAVVAGYTDSADLPVRQAVQSVYGGFGDGLAASLNPGGTAWNYVTYFGGSNADELKGVSVDAAGNAYLAGSAASVNLPPTAGALRTAAGSYDALLIMLAPSGAAVFSALIGGAGADAATAVTVDQAGQVWMGGFTASWNFPCQFAVQGSNRGGIDGFLARFTPDGSAVLTATYLGGSGDDRVLALALAPQGIVAAGITSSPDFPAVAGIAGIPVYPGFNGFVTRLDGGPPEPVSVTPASGSGSQQRFDLTVRDPGGYANIGTLLFLVNAGISAGNACYLWYDRGGNSLALASDAGTWSGRIPLGAAGVLENSQCRVNAATAAVSGAGEYLTLSADVSFTTASPGWKNTYLYVANQDGQTLGWRQMGAWLVPSLPPAPVSVSPPSGAGNAQRFTFTVSDDGGYTRIGDVLFVLNATLSAAGSCYLWYDARNNSLGLASDAGTWGAPAPLGSPGALENSQCRADLGTAAVAFSGNLLTVGVDLTFKPAFAGPKNTYLYAANREWQTTGWRQMGTWLVPSLMPEPVSVSPPSGSGNAQRFSFTVSDDGGYARIGDVLFLLGGGLSATNSCYLWYDGRNNSIGLASDAGVWSAQTPLGSAAVLENSQCRLNVATAAAAFSGNLLTVGVDLTFKPAFAGPKNSYLYVANRDWQTSGWRQMGTWLVPSRPPDPVSISPPSGSGYLQRFSLTVSDDGGYARIGDVLFLVGGGLSATNSCYLWYDARSHSLSLASDAGSWSAQAPLGSGAVLENSQCRVSVATAAAVFSGNLLTVGVDLTFKPAFTGPKNSYLYAANRDWETSGWRQMGTWLVP